MKKLLALVLLAALLLTVCGCTSGVYEADGVRLTVDWEQCQIDDGQYVYQFSWEKTDSQEMVTITYPNGAQNFFIGKNGTVLASGVKQLGDISAYVSPEVLYAVIADHRPLSAMVFQGFSGRDILTFIAAVIIIIVGLFVASDPEAALNFGFSGWLENVEYTDRTLIWLRIEGVVTVLSAIGLIAYTIFNAFA